MSERSGREIESEGSSPNRTAVATESPNVKPKTMPSSRISAARGRWRASTCTIECKLHLANKRPPTPPAARWSLHSIVHVDALHLPRAEIGVSDGIAPLQHIHLSTRLLQGDLRLQSSESFQKSYCAPSPRWKGGPFGRPSHPHIHVSNWKSKTGWQNADDCIRDRVNRGRLTYDLRIAIEPSS